MNKCGHEYLTVKNICETARISNGTFFYYFKTKDDLLAYYLEEGFHNYMDSHYENHDNKNIKEQVIDVYICYASYCKEHGLEFISNYYSTKNKSLNTRFYKKRDLNTRKAIANNKSKMDPFLIFGVIEDIRNAQINGYIFSDVNPETAGFDLCTVVKGIMFDWCLSGGTLELENYMGKMLGIYLDNILTEKFWQHCCPNVDFGR
jgi:AcrR family transcriptional regulator